MSATELSDGYFVAIGQSQYLPTQLCGGAWRDDELHLAPVVGLMVHELEAWRSNQHLDHLMFSRFAIEVLGVIAPSTISIHIDVVRPGRTIELVEAVATINGKITIRARAWLLHTSDTSEIAGNEFADIPSPDAMQHESTLLQWPGGFCSSLEGVQSEVSGPGRSQTWLRSNVPLLTNEPVSELAHFCRLLDAANGVAIRVTPDEWMYPNVDITLHFFRMPRGEWVGLDTRVSFGHSGVGLTSSVIHDLFGAVGVVNQSLTLRKKS